jgi:hypothetical protein
MRRSLSPPPMIATAPRYAPNQLPRCGRNQCPGAPESVPKWLRNTQSQWTVTRDRSKSAAQKEREARGDQLRRELMAAARWNLRYSGYDPSADAALEVALHQIARASQQTADYAASNAVRTALSSMLISASVRSENRLSRLVLLNV